jgi:hypothetical protein
MCISTTWVMRICQIDIGSAEPPDIEAAEQ